jgi:hypothetical protein
MVMIGSRGTILMKMMYMIIKLEVFIFNYFRFHIYLILKLGIISSVNKSCSFTEEM